MAQLTWRNVDAPSFSSVTETYRLMNDAMNRGFSAGQRALEGYQKDLTDSVSSQVMQAAMAARDPAQLSAITAGVNPALISADALNFVAGRPQQLADLTKTQVYTQGLQQDQAQSAELHPLRMTNQRLANESQDITNTFNRQRNPHLVDAAILQNQGTQIRNADSAVDLNTKIENKTKADLVREALTAAVNGGANETERVQIAQSFAGRPGFDATMVNQVLEQLKAVGPNLAVRGADAATVSMNAALQRQGVDVSAPQVTSPLITYRNQGATRNDPLSPQLTQAITPVLQNLGVTMEVVSGGQESNRPGQGTGSTRHNHGGAGDVRFYRNGRMLDWNNQSDIPVLQEIVRQGRANGLTGFGAGPGYMGRGMMHIGFGTPAVWGAGGSSANAPDWLKQAFESAASPGSNRGTGPVRGTPASPAPQMIAQAAQPAAAAPQASSFMAPGVPVATDPNDVQTALDQATYVSGAMQKILDVSQMDAGWNAMAPIVSDFLKQENKDKGSYEVAKDLFKRIGDSNEGGIWAASGLTESKLADAINVVSQRYGIAPHMAAGFIANAVAVNPETFNKDGRYVDYTAIDRHMQNFLNRDGKVNTSVLTSQIEAVRGKEQVAEKVKLLNSQLESAKQAYLEALARKQQNPNATVDVKRYFDRYQAILKTVDRQVDDLSKNRFIEINTRGQLSTNRTGNQGRTDPAQVLTQSVMPSAQAAPAPAASFPPLQFDQRILR